MPRAALQFGYHPRGSHRGALGRRAGFVLLLAIVVAAGVGLFGGGGPLAERSASDGPATVHWQSPTRVLLPGQLRIAVLRPGSDRLQVSLPDHYLRDVRVEQVVPRPVAEVIGGGRTSWEFAVREEAGSADVTFWVMPRRMGRHAVDVQVEFDDDVAATVELRQVVLP
jgi:hypothetical protein